MENCYLVVGLGNPGAEYASTRHNIGFLLVDRLGKHLRGHWTLDKKFKSRIARVQLDQKRLLLCQPQTYMNLSGEAVRAVMAYYAVPLNRVLVLVDDADLPLGNIRLRPRGSSGGHHGLESIEQHLATQDYARLRLGIGRQRNAERQITDYVLGRFTADETLLVEKVLERTLVQVEYWVTAGIQKAMTKFNGLIKDTETKDLE